MHYQLFASESVAAGHPDKVCDQISDAIVDAILEHDPHGRIGLEAIVGADQIILAGEITTTAHPDLEAIARQQIRRLGYTEPAWGFSDQSPILLRVGRQSPEISQGVDQEGAGDQGMMFGYASHDTPELMPLPITLAHALTRRLDHVREAGQLAYLRPDGKSQVVVRYAGLQPVGVEHVTIATAHAKSVHPDQVRQDIYDHVIAPVLADYGYEIPLAQVIINGTGAWYQPGPASDAGLTGRKIVVDSYGGFARVGGGAFSGKDPTKVDRSAAYAARYLAKNLVAAGLATHAEVALAYVIGQRHPVLQQVNSFGTATVSEAALHDFMNRLLDTSVRGIVEALDLRRPIYLPTAAYGHFGVAGRPWEALAKP